MKHNVNAPIKPKMNIFRRIRNEKDEIDDPISSDTYRVNLKNEKGR